jgi:RHS repeat-associated protein
MSDTPAGSSEQQFTWDTAPSVPELLEDGTNFYLYGPNVGSSPIEQITADGSTSSYLVSDTTGVREQLASSGIVTGSMTYSSYGAPCADCSISTPFGFEGGYTDATDLVYLVHRYYDPTTAQFLSVDPLVTQTQRPYSYVDGDPVNSTDPSGLRGAGHLTPRAVCEDEHATNMQSCVAQDTAIQEQGPVDAADQNLLAPISSFIASHSQLIAGGACIVLGPEVCAFAIVFGAAERLNYDRENGGLTGQDWLSTGLVAAAELLTAGTGGLVEKLGEDASPLMFNIVSKGLSAISATPFSIIDLNDLNTLPGSQGDLASVNGGRCTKDY